MCQPTKNACIRDYYFNNYYYCVFIQILAEGINLHSAELLDLRLLIKLKFSLMYENIEFIILGITYL